MIAEQKAPEEMSAATFSRVVAKIHLLTGITITEQKKTMVQSRLKKRMKTLSIASFDDYMSFLEKDKSETQEFINVVTTNETSFFRTPRIWEYFQNEYLPKWHAENPKTPLRIWSAASSSGEEAFSLAICCADFQKRNPGFEFRIHATDISTEVLNEAQKGIYGLRSVEFLKKSRQQLFDQYFTHGENETFKVVNDIKNKVHFTTHNLFTVKKEQYDLIFLRNVLIYFVGVDQEKVLNNVGQSLDPNGVLVIGESESLNRLETPYEFVQACIYNKKR